MKRIIYNILFVSLLAVASWSCQDETFIHFDNPGDGMAMVHPSITFQPLVPVELESRTQGNAIEEIKNLSILIYDTDGRLITNGYRYYARPGSDFQTETNPEGTYRATVDPFPLPFGTYHIYAIANMGNMNASHPDEILTETEMRGISLDWETVVADNDRMSGYFEKVESADHTSGRPDKMTNSTINHSVTVNREDVFIHSWVRRTVAKVTVAFDASDLRDNIEIYIKTVQIRDIPKTCTLVENHKVEYTGGLQEGETLELWRQGNENFAQGRIDSYKTWPVVSAGNENYTLRENIMAHHGPDSPALFAFENLQDEHTDCPKGQTDDNGEIRYPNANDPNHPDYAYRKDNVKNGTYIEVEAYYVSTASGNEGKGPIFYRFMLGKDILCNYDLERNNHLKLTLHFNGNANDIDWHIEYREEDKPGMYLPDPYYISYLYDQEMEYPIRLEGEINSDYLEANIVENNWGPCEDPDTPGKLSSLDYYDSSKGPVWTSKDRHYDGVWNGFLTLYYQEGANSIADGARDSDAVYDAWFTKGKGEEYSDRNPKKSEGYRRYSTHRSDPPGVYEHKDKNGRLEYRVVKTDKETRLYIKMYTRPLLINGFKSFSGNNPYFSFMRKARVHFKIDNISGVLREGTSTIYQVRRLINPKLILRPHDSQKPFLVQLCRRKGETEVNNTITDNFELFRSSGSWKAEIIDGRGWEIVGGTASGKSGSYIMFTVRPTGTIASNDTRSARVRVMYHNYTCVHYIFLKQGYAPTQVVPGGAYWHTRNLWYYDSTNSKAYETESVVHEGSMFRYGNVNQAIDALNSPFANKFTNKALTVNNQNVYIMAPVPSSKERMVSSVWNSISNNKSSSFSSFKPKIDGVECRLPRFKDFNALKGNSDITFGFGLAYGNGASTVQFEAEHAFRSSWFTQTKMENWPKTDYNYTSTPLWGTDPNGSYGIRICSAYNIVTNKLIFFHIGQSGFGRRKDGYNESGNRGVLRYANRGGAMVADPSKPQVQYTPLLYNIYAQYGAIYWLGYSESSHTAWDINNSTFDFNGFQNNAIALSDGTDACFIRLVQDTAP